ncbi:unnamed protein product [Brassica oleracea]
MTGSSGKIRERWTYDVFLNFRGPDMRNGFMGHLYKSLVRSGIYAFKDDEEIERGEDISPKLLKAIENSKIHLVVLSPNYASSRWCLDELVHIMQCREMESGHMLLPIFYDVHPADVRVQIGPFAEAFDKHRGRYTESKVQTWKATLASVAHLRGYVYSGNDVSLIEVITRDILQRLPSSYLHLPTYGVGIKLRVRRINEFMCFDSDDVQTIGLCGMGGIGKTTLAKAAYNEYSYSFEGTSFLENFGEYFKKPQGKVHLQQKLLSDILRRHDIVFNNMDHAVKHRFRNKRVLVVLDNVEDVKQLHSTAIDWSCFGPGSRIIITSRNKHLLEQLGVVNIYSPDALNGKESLELVSWHSFRTEKPPADFRQLSEKLVEYCGGLPLAMEILGAFLFKRSISEWRSTLELLKQTPNADIQAKLQISFDTLDPEQKDIFLDISCFFIGMDKDYVNCILDGCKLYPDIGLTVLKERFLVTVRDNRLVMHGLLREMGRNIVRGTSRNHCERWSRLWDPDDAIDVLANNSGTDAIEGLSLKVGATDDENLVAEAFSNLRNLRLLQLSHVRLKGSYEYFPRGLRWFCWFEYPQHSIPLKLHLGSVVVMDLQYSNLKQLCHSSWEN